MKSSPSFIYLFIGIFLLMCGFTSAQSPIAVECNYNVTVTMFFPSKVVRVVPPSVNYKFEYDKDTNIGLLQGRKGNPSNLTVITENGYIYSFALNYSEDVQKFNYILKSEQAIGKTKSEIAVQLETASESDLANKESITNSSSKNPIEQSSKKQNDAPSEAAIVTDVSDPLVITESETDSGTVVAVEKLNNEEDLYDIDSQEYYRIFCENNYLQKTIFKRSFRQNKRIVLKLNNILVDRDDIYFVLQIENNSKKEYLLDGLSFFRKSVVGQLEKIMMPRYTFNLQETIDPDSINEIVYVFKKFKISNKELIHVVLAEKDSNNMVILPLDDKQINYPSN